MNVGTLEHLNVTVSDPDATAAVLCNLFDWHVRWTGRSELGGRSVHVGADNNYLALYVEGGAELTTGRSYGLLGGLNHIGVVVDDLDEAEARVTKAGLKAYAHGDYEPGRRFYFDIDGVEIEVVSYATL